MKRLNKKGFTLVELLAVIVILGVLLLIAVPAISTITADSKFNSAKDSAMNVLEAGRTCSMAKNAICDKAAVASYIDATGTIGTLTLDVPADNPIVKAFSYTENGYTITFSDATGCSISTAKSQINKVTRDKPTVSCSGNPSAAS